jgi:hypothetical protein
LEIVKYLKTEHPDTCQSNKLSNPEANDVNPAEVDLDLVADAVACGYWKDPVYVVSYTMFGGL